MDRPLVHPCAHPECSTLTMGDRCIEHEAPVTRVFPRGRPFVTGEGWRVVELPSLAPALPQREASPSTV